MTNLKAQMLKEFGSADWFRGCGVGLDRVTGQRQVVVSVSADGFDAATSAIRELGVEDGVVVRVLGDVVAQPAKRSATAARVQTRGNAARSKR